MKRTVIEKPKVAVGLIYCDSEEREPLIYTSFDQPVRSAAPLISPIACDQANNNQKVLKLLRYE